jgi:hypothetical protein
MDAREAWRRAADCAARAEEAADEHTRILFIKLRDSWIHVANHWAFLNDAMPDTPEPVGLRPAEYSEANK